jgi:anti-sigma B factor antagonist
MQLTTDVVDHIAVITPMAEALDAGNAKAFRNAMAPVLNVYARVALDLSGIGFVDSSGCGVLLSCLKRTNQAGGDLKLFSVQKPVRAMFELIRLHRIMDILNNRQEAIRAFD